VTERTLDLTTSSLVRVLFGALLLVFLVFIRDILALLALALALTAAVTPALQWLDREGIPRPVGVVVVLLLLVAVVAGVIAVIIPPLAAQLRDLDADLPRLLERVRTVLEALGVPVPASFGSTLEASIDTLTGFVRSVGSDVAAGLSTFGRSVGSVLVVLVLTLYFSLAREGVRGLYRPFVPEDALPFLARLENRIERRLGHWLRGQVLVSAAVILVTFAGFLLLGLRYPLVLALVGGMTVFVPAISFVLAGIPAVLAAGAVSPAVAVATAVFVVLVHQLAAAVVLPRVVGPAVHLNPGVVLALLLAGAAVSGVVGLLLAVPLAAAVAATVELVREP
jgi:predicted PurR-regulated permease PerM